MNARTLIATVGATLALVGPATAAQAATSATTNVWRSPTGNIACRYYPSLAAVTCQTDNDHYAVAVGRYSSTAFHTTYRYIPSSAIRLVYGERWTAPGLVCLSTAVGMGCEADTGHGFAINRDRVTKW
jgi:hypothetical protein